MSRLCKRDATKRKIEHMPNIIVMGNALTFKGKPKELVSVKLRGGGGGELHIPKPIKSQIQAMC